jgi:hypothetical protein
MQIRRKNNLDAVSDGLLIKPDGHKWDWLRLQAIFPLLISLALVVQVAATPAYPLHPSDNGRYVVDSNNVPFLIIGDAPHSILAKLNNADAITYLTNRGSNGFNALWIELLCDSYTGGEGTEGSPNYGRDVNGNNPFTSTLPGGYYDLTTPNPAYWSHVDYIVQTAATNGLQCVFTPLDQGGWTQTSLANGTNRCYQYGQFLGNRYKNSPNIIWNLGNDFQRWRTHENDAVILAIADGIKSADTNHLMTVQLNYYVSESQDDPNWIPRITANGVYTYYPTYDETLVAYNKPNVMPVLFLEAHYEHESGRGEFGTPKILRRHAYWSLTSGALAGHMYGNHYTWTFTSGWQSHLQTPGMNELMYFKNFFSSRRWYNLVPDQSHTLLTAGYGTYTTDGHVGDSEYATAAKTPDGKLAVVYTPVSHTLTIALNNFSGPVTARWYDPTANRFAAIPGSPFPNVGTHNFTTPGNNSAGDRDWVLVLEVVVEAPRPRNQLRATVTDFNGDSHPDWVVRNAGTRQTGIWYMNNNVFMHGAYGPTLVAGWGLRGVADFNRDSHPDYALFNSITDRTAIWYLSGPTFIWGAYGPTLPSGWELLAMADFNSNGYPDYVLYKASTRQTAIWYLNNNVFVGGAYGPTLPAGWSLVAVADFDRNGHRDYALFNSGTGQTAIWYLSGLTFVGGAYGPNVPSGWQLVAAADFNGNGKPDYLLYKASTRQTAIWYLNNNVYVSGAYGPTLPAGWSLGGQ